MVSMTVALGEPNEVVAVVERAADVWSVTARMVAFAVVGGYHPHVAVGHRPRQRDRGRARRRPLKQNSSL